MGSSGSKEIRVVMFGGIHPGKTSILYRLTAGERLEVDAVIPTIGFNSETIKFRKHKLNIIDIGTGPLDRKLHTQWNTYLDGLEGPPHAVIYVVDAKAAAADDEDKKKELDESCEQLHKYVIPYLNKNSLLLVFANKQDLPNCLSTNEIVERLKLQQLKIRWHIQECSALHFSGIFEGISWILNEVHKKWNQEIGKHV